MYKPCADIRYDLWVTVYEMSCILYVTDIYDSAKKT